MAKKILILSASPIRDKYVDELLAHHLQQMGNEVWVKSSPDEGQPSVMDIQPDIVVVPPVRNVYGRDFVENLKRWGMGVIVRHTEPSCDKKDWDKMSGMEKNQILGLYPYQADLEIVWGEFEAEILNNRKRFPTKAAGSFSTALYKNDIIPRISREQFNAKWGFDNTKKNLIIGSAWGFVDSAPDKYIDSTEVAQRDKEGRVQWLETIKTINLALGKKWNILVTFHPHVLAEPYKEILEPLGMKLDAKSPAFDLLTNADALIHAGSTMGVAMHILNKPAYQYGDQNVKEGGWWLTSDVALSKVSPKAGSVSELIEMIMVWEDKSNANPDAIKELEEEGRGRYGLMDGKAIERAAELINKIEGKFKLEWPKPWRDYSQITLLKDVNEIITGLTCGICGFPFVRVNDSWLEKLQNFLGLTKPIKPSFDESCPICGYRLVIGRR